MPLGIEQNNLAPQLIQNSGAALVQGIRQIGQQISGHLTELQTKRDLGAMAQDLQGLNVESNEFPIQLMQVGARHPLAIRDERGQMAISILGKSHAQWQATQADALAFQRQMKMQQQRTSDAQSNFTFEQDYKRKNPQYIPGVGVTTLEDETGQPNVLLPVQPKGSTAMPFRSTPQGIMDARTGTITSPTPAKTMTEYQRAQLRRAERKDKISAINQEINQFDSNIASAERAYEAAFKREMDAKDTEKKRHELDKTEVGKVADALKAEKKKKIELLEKLRKDDDVDAAIPAEMAGTDDLGLPPVTPNAASPAPVTAVGKDGKRYEVDPVTKKVIRAL